MNLNLFTLKLIKKKIIMIQLVLRRAGSGLGSLNKDFEADLNYLSLRFQLHLN